MGYEIEVKEEKESMREEPKLQDTSMQDQETIEEKKKREEMVEGILESKIGVDSEEKWSCRRN